MAKYVLSVSAVMVNPATGLPLVETGKEAKITVDGAVFRGRKDGVDEREVFLAMAHSGAENLWPDFKKLLDETTPSGTPPPSSASQKS